MAKYKALQGLWEPAGSTSKKKKSSNGAQQPPAKLRIPSIKYPAGSTSKSGADPSHSGMRKYIADHSLRLEFFGIAANESAKFIPMDLEYSESFQSEWNHVSVYGRNDPMSTFQGTKRTIKLTFVVGANSPADARANMIEISNLTSLLYPTYYDDLVGVAQDIATVGNATTIEAAPLLRVHLNNLILDPSGTAADGSGLNGPARNVGLVCAASGLDITPNFENGAIITAAAGSSDPDVGWEVGGKTHKHLAGAPKGQRIYPKTFSISTTLTVFHTFPLGFRRGEGNGDTNSYARSRNGFGSFPWGEKHVYAETEVKGSKK